MTSITFASIKTCADECFSTSERYFSMVSCSFEVAEIEIIPADLFDENDELLGDTKEPDPELVPEVFPGEAVEPLDPVEDLALELVEV